MNDCRTPEMIKQEIEDFVLDMIDAVPWEVKQELPYEQWPQDIREIFHYHRHKIIDLQNELIEARKYWAKQTRLSL